MIQKKENNFECSAVNKWIEIELTNYCWLNCLICPRNSVKNLSFLNFIDFKKIVSLLKIWNYKELIVWWLWDAFLHKNLNKFLIHLFSEIPDIKLIFMTKGVSIPKKYLGMIGDFKNKWFSITLTFSIFSLDEKLYNYMTWWNNFIRFKKTFDIVKNMNLDYSMEFLIFTLNLWEFNKFKKFSFIQNKDFHISLVHNWWWKIKKEIHKKFFCEKKLKNHLIKKQKWDICEVISSNYFYIDCHGKVFLCSVNCLEKNYIWKLKDLELFDIYNKKWQIDYDKFCNKCFYYLYNTRN